MNWKAFVASAPGKGGGRGVSKTTNERELMRNTLKDHKRIPVHPKTAINGNSNLRVSILIPSEKKYYVPYSIWGCSYAPCEEHLSFDSQIIYTGMI